MWEPVFSSRSEVSKRDAEASGSVQDEHHQRDGNGDGDDGDHCLSLLLEGLDPTVDQRHELRLPLDQGANVRVEEFKVVAVGSSHFEQRRGFTRELGFGAVDRRLDPEQRLPQFGELGGIRFGSVVRTR